MPYIVESQERLGKCQKQLEAVFGEKVLSHLNALLQEKGFQAVPYLNGVLDEERTNQIMALWHEAARKGDSSCFTPDTFGKDVMTMGEG